MTVEALLHFNASPIADDSVNGLTFTIENDVTISNVTPKFGAGCLQLEYVVGNAAIPAAYTEWPGGALNDFTISCWVRGLNTLIGASKIFEVEGAGYVQFHNLVHSGTSRGYGAHFGITGWNSSELEVPLSTNNAGDVQVWIHDWDNWHHIALVKLNGIVVFYLDGVAQETPINDSETSNEATPQIIIGEGGINALFTNENPPAEAVILEWDDFCFASNNAYWVKDFTPPTSAFVIPELTGLDTNTRILLHFDEETAGVVTDASQYNHECILYNDTALSSDNGRFGSKGVSADPAGIDGYGYAEITNAADMCFPYNTTKAIDFWFKASAQSARVDFLKGSGATYLITVLAGDLCLFGCAPIADFDVYLDDVWHHFAVVIAVEASPSTVELLTVYVDGALFGSINVSTAYWKTISAYVWHVCERNENTGTLFMDEFRFSDVGRYTGAFDPEPIEYGVFTAYNYLTVNLPVLTGEQHTGVCVAVTLPIAMTSHLECGYIRCTMSNTLEALTANLRTGVKIIDEFPSLIANIHAKVSALCDIAEDLPNLTAYLRTGVGITETLPMLSTVASAKVGVSINIAVGLPNLQSSIVAKTGILIDIEATLPALTGSLAGFPTITNAVAATLPRLTAALAGRIEQHGNVIGTFAALTSALHAITGLKANIAGSFLALQGESFVLPTAYETFCLNLLKPELVSKFLNYSFNSYAIINGVEVGCTVTGLFRLDGDSDAGTRIVSHISFPALDFGSYLKKKVYGFNIGGRMAGDIAVSVSNGIDTWSTTLTKVLTGFQRGFFVNETRGDYLTFSIVNSAGNAFTINALDLYLMFLEG